jgi:hypothetical protein
LRFAELRVIHAVLGFLTIKDMEQRLESKGTHTA